MNQSPDTRPLLALAMGDPCGISPELTARLCTDDSVTGACRLMVIGDRRIYAMGCEHAGIKDDLAAWASDGTGHGLHALGHLAPGDVERGTASLAGGQFALTNFVTALQLGASRDVDAVTFTPFNKQAMRMARPGYDDEIGVITEVLKAPRDGREFNILEGLWNARVTSHIPLKDVAAHLTVPTIVKSAQLAHHCLVQAGVDKPRIAVAALNPHAGDGGSFGREEIDILDPAIEKIRADSIDAYGPVPADTVFVRARKGEFDAVLTMYHDQGQIAMKLMGFDQGVTFLGGYDVPVCTPAHGTAYDIAGKGIADIKAARNALLLAAEMALTNKARAAKAA